MSRNLRKLDNWLSERRKRKTGTPKGQQFSILPGQCTAFRYFASALLTVSIGVACIENGLHPLLLLLLPVVIAALLRPDYSRPYIWPERVTLILFIVYVMLFSITVFLIHGRLTLPKFMVYFTFGIVLVRALSPLSDRNLSQLIALSAGLILVNCILTNHLVFGLFLPVYFFALMGTLLLFHLARNRAQTGELVELPTGGTRFAGTWYGKLVVYTLWVVAFTTVMFVFVPRPFFVIPGLRTAMANAGGLAELEKRISYRDMTGMAGRNRTAFKVKVHQGKLPETPYWRGRILGKFDGLTWSAAENLRGMGRIVRANPRNTLDFQFIPYRLQSKIIYVSGLPVTALGRKDKPLFITSAAEVIVDSPFLFADSYYLSTVNRPVPASFRKDPVYRDMTGITPRIDKLAREWTDKYSSLSDKAAEITKRLRSNYGYKLVPPPTPEGVNPIEYFLFESKSGNCEHFSGALCLMLRAIGIPARVVEGFAGMEATEVSDEFIVRFARAHAWVEALLDDRNWSSLDATPAVGLAAQSRLWRFLLDLYDNLEYQWIKQVVYFDRSDQANAMRAIGRMLTGDFSLPKVLAAKLTPVMKPLVAAVGLMLTALIVFYALRRKPTDWSAVYLKTMKQLVGEGILTRIHPWHEQNTAEIIKRSPRSRDAVARFMSTYLEGRFGTRRRVSIEDLEKARQDLLHTVQARS